MSLETVPLEFEYIGDVMTNFDHSIEPDAEEKLRVVNFMVVILHGTFMPKYGLMVRILGR